jgi:hypothetical protein
LIAVEERAQLPVNVLVAEVKRPRTFVPIKVTAARRRAATSATIGAYSTIVAPASTLVSRLRNSDIVVYL